ncbi:protoporphyrinogen oxidase [Cenarchaeum symbiosum A]|uniref:Protoporphyrinogen oxidase n=1 Tax=Cenarchaeum symbiosum (strain A) TaxID=414004 RepID=A0RWH4_CENSY|nr:protoporphyrinogen oxidase [Cenarchaeum symbiosum A]
MEVVVVGAGISGLCSGAMLAAEGIRVTVLESSSRVGGRTASTRYKGHILDNGFHIMPFYKTSAVYGVFKRLGILDRLDLARVDRIAFYKDGFHVYPRGLGGMISTSLVPVRSRIRLLRMLLPMAFSSYERAEKLDPVPLSSVTGGLDAVTGSFFDAVCMLAFADRPDNISLGEFTRTMIRANPFKGGTSEFAYPNVGGYDEISRILAEYITEKGGTVRLSTPVSRVHVESGRVAGITAGEFHECGCVVVSSPAYLAVTRLFEGGTFDDSIMERAKKLDKTTSVVEAHFCLSERMDARQIVFPVGEYSAKGIFFISNITPNVSPEGEHLVMAGTPVSAADADSPSRVAEVVGEMKEDIESIYPGFSGSLLWEKAKSWRFVESVAKGPGMVWKDKMPHTTNVKGLFFVGDATVSYGIGTDSAAHSSLLCHPKILGFLSNVVHGAEIRSKAG